MTRNRAHEVRTIYRAGADRRHRIVWAACSCGWRGPERARVWEVRFDRDAHLEGWGDKKA